MSTNATAQKNEKALENAKPVEKNKTDNVVVKKLYSILSVWAAFVILYLAVNSGNDKFIAAGLGITILSTLYLYSKN